FTETSIRLPTRSGLEGYSQSSSHMPSQPSQGDFVVVEPLPVCLQRAQLQPSRPITPAQSPAIGIPSSSAPARLEIESGTKRKRRPTAAYVQARRQAPWVPSVGLSQEKK